jgi:dihydropteroate synthase
MSSSVRETDPPAVTRGALEVRGTRLVWGARTYLMGVVNVTPDSFSGDGSPDAAAAIARALAQRAVGADVVDLGAESTRPGHTPIALDEELRRLVLVVRGVREQAPDAIISIDTFKPEVLRAAHAAGGDVLNSIWGLDDRLLETALECGVPVVLMHNKAVPVYERGVVDEVLASLEAAARRAVDGGLAAERIMLDPGLGFGKLPEHNIALLRALPRLVALGFPTLLGPSRKSTIGKLTGKPVGDRAFGTAAAVAMAVLAGIDVVRVHDVAEMRDVVAVADAVTRGWRPAGWSESL